MGFSASKVHPQKYFHFKNLVRSTCLLGRKEVKEKGVKYIHDDYTCFLFSVDVIRTILSKVLFSKFLLQGRSHVFSLKEGGGLLLYYCYGPPYHV